MWVETDFLSWTVSAILPRSPLSRMLSRSLVNPSGDMGLESLVFPPFSLPDSCLSQLTSLLLSRLWISVLLMSFFLTLSVSLCPAVAGQEPTVDSLLPSHWEILSRMLALLLTAMGVLESLPLQLVRPFSAWVSMLVERLWASMSSPFGLSPKPSGAVSRAEPLPLSPCPSPPSSGRWGTAVGVSPTFNPQHWSLHTPKSTHSHDCSLPAVTHQASVITNSG